MSFIKNSATILSMLLAFGVEIHAQHGYWQQHVSYQMEIDTDVEKHQFAGKQKLVYQNNSPDTLTKVFYHLYFNAFQPGSMMDIRSRTIPDPDPRVGDRISKLKPEEIGYHTIQSFTQDAKQVNYVVRGTVLDWGSLTLFHLGSVGNSIWRTLLTMPLNKEPKESFLKRIKSKFY